MSCNGCRVLRKGCSEGCVLRHCLRWIESAEAQAHATLFVTKFFGRAGLTSFINGVSENERPALFQSLLYEACGRTVNPVYGAVGLLSSGNWDLCQAAVETVLKGGLLKPVTVDNKAKAQSISTNPNAVHQNKAMSVAPSDMPVSSSRSSLQEPVRPEPEQSTAAETNHHSSGLSSSIEGKIIPQTKRVRDGKNKESFGEQKVVSKKIKSSENGNVMPQHGSPKRPKLSNTRTDKHLNSEAHVRTNKAINMEIADTKSAPLAMADMDKQMAAEYPKLEIKDISPIQGEMRTSMARCMNKWPSPLIEGLIQGAKQGQCSFSEEISSLVSSYENASNCNGSVKRSMNIDLNLTLKPQHLTPNISSERPIVLQRVPSPSADSEGSVTGLYRSTAESPKEELKLLRLLL